MRGFDCTAINVSGINPVVNGWRMGTASILGQIPSNYIIVLVDQSG